MQINTYTTLAVGEEGETIRPPITSNPGFTHESGYEEGVKPNPIPVFPPKEFTTLAVGEEGENRVPGDPVYTTTLIAGEEGEEIPPPGDNYTTLAVGEEGGHIPYPITHNDILQIYLHILLLYLSQYNNGVNMSFGRANV